MTLKKPIIFVTISMTGGGTERVIALLANHFASMKNDITIALIGGEEVVYKLNNEVKVKKLVGKTGGSINGKLKRIVRLHELFGQSECNIIAMGSVCGLYASLANIGIKRNNLIISERNIPDRINKTKYSWWLRLIRDILYNRANRVVLQTEESRNFFPKRIVNKSVVICNPIDNEIRAPYQGERTHRIVSAGRLTEDKGYKYLIDAFSNIAMQCDYNLEIYGSGEKESEIMEYISEKNVEDRVSVYPFDPDIHNKIADAKVYVSSSLCEGISNSIMEALALGIPVIATDCPIGGSRMLVKDGINGYLVPTANSRDMADAIKRLINSDEYDILSKNAIQIRSKYSVDNIVSEWRSILV